MSELLKNKEKKLLGFKDLERDVINKGLCNVCGTCAGVCPNQSIEMIINDYESGEPKPVLTGKCVLCSICYDTCPGKNVPLADLDEFIFSRQRKVENESLGIFKSCYKGYGTGETRVKSSSGGIVTGIIQCALSEGIVDAAIIAVRSPQHPWRAEPGIITEHTEANNGVRSVMEVVPINSLLHKAIVEKGHKKVAIVGLPCQIHGLRKLQKEGKPGRLANAVALTIGLFCNSTTYFIGVEHLIKEIGGIKKFNKIKGLDYRAGDYPGSMMVMTDDGKMQTIASRDYYTGYFSKANYRRDRCLMCVDFSSELADISVGDVFNHDDANLRWSAAIVRTDEGEIAFNKAIEKEFISAEPYDYNLIPYGGTGWEMTKHASTYRLMERKKHGWPVPNFQYEPVVKILSKTKPELGL